MAQNAAAPLVERSTEAPALYVGTYAKYNNGSIKGDWLYLEDYADVTEFWTACEKLHADESDPEFMFQDYENFPSTFYSESYSTLDLEKLYDWVHLDDNEREIVAEYADATGYSVEDIDLDAAQERHFTTLTGNSHNYDEELGNYIIEEGLLGINIPDELQHYIDAEAIGRDWLMDMSVSSNGFVFTNQ